MSSAKHFQILRGHSRIASGQFFNRHDRKLVVCESKVSDPTSSNASFVFWR